MKYLPCSICRTTAQATKKGVSPVLLHSIGSMVSPSIRYLCRRCGLSSTLTFHEFARLPEMTIEEITADSSDMPLSALDHPSFRQS